MKEYIIATLASLCFVNPIENNKEHSTLNTQNEKSDSKYEKFDKPFGFKKTSKQDKIIYDTAPTKWTKVK